MRIDNYPDDIRQYDNDPRSPFFDEGPELDQEEVANNLADEWLKNPGIMDEHLGDYEEDRMEFTRLICNALRFHSEHDNHKDFIAQALSVFEGVAKKAANDFLERNK